MLKTFTLITALPLCLLAIPGCNKEEPAPATPASAPSASASAAPASSDAPVASASAAPNAAPEAPAIPAPQKSDSFATSKGPLDLTPIHHASLLFQWNGKNIYVDPASQDASYEGLPKADYIFITDIHPDHLDSAQIAKLKTDKTILVGPQAVSDKEKMTVVLKNGEKKDFGDFKVEAIPMYNLKRGPEAGKFFHDKGRGDGYVFTFGDKRVYDSGDTECTPEMKALKKIDVAFVNMNLPYTMPPDEAATCVNAFKPAIVIPFHYKGSDTTVFEKALKPGIEVRERDWYGKGPGKS